MKMNNMYKKIINQGLLDDLGQYGVVGDNAVYISINSSIIYGPLNFQYSVKNTKKWLLSETLNLNLFLTNLTPKDKKFNKLTKTYSQKTVSFPLNVDHQGSIDFLKLHHKQNDSRININISSDNKKEATVPYGLLIKERSQDGTTIAVELFSLEEGRPTGVLINFTSSEEDDILFPESYIKSDTLPQKASNISTSRLEYLKELLAIGSPEYNKLYNHIFNELDDSVLLDPILVKGFELTSSLSFVIENPTHLNFKLINFKETNYVKSIICEITNCNVKTLAPDFTSSKNGFSFLMDEEELGLNYSLDIFPKNGQEGSLEIYNTWENNEDGYVNYLPGFNLFYIEQQNPGKYLGFLNEGTTNPKKEPIDFNDAVFELTITDIK